MRDSGAKSIERTVFGCAVCHARWTAPLRALPAWLQGGARELCTEVPTGWWSLRDEPRGRPGHPAVVHPHDVKNLIPHEDIQRRIGCCGVGYREGLPNLRCARCGVDAGYELSDGDHCYHAVFFPLAGCVRVPVDEPDDDTLHARFEARRGEQGALPEDAGMAALPLDLKVDPDAVWGDDVPRVSAFTELSDLEVRIVGRELRVRLDGVWFRPPWPEGERDRLIALGAIPRGRAHEPLFWWTDLPAAQGDPDHHRWNQWCVDGALCVVWERWPGGQSRDGSQVAFRVPWPHWLAVWRAALASGMPEGPADVLAG